MKKLLGHPSQKLTSSALKSRAFLSLGIGRITVNTYDALYRLTEEVISDPINGQHQSSYTFDKVGNRLTSIINGVETTFVYDDNDRIISQGDTTYSYDKNGNTISKTLNVGSQNESVVLYDYNDKNKLSRVVTDSSVNRYRYDINNNRVEKIEGTNTTRFIVDNNQPYAQVIAEQDNTNAISKEYVFGDDLVSQSQSNQSHYYMYDGLGSTRGLTDANGDLTDSYNYEAFGELLNATGNTDNNYLYTGEQYDAGLDNYYLRARYYDQGIGRFTQQDTWMGKSCTPITLNKYIYAHAEPSNLVDPSGNSPLIEQITAIGKQATLMLKRGTSTAITVRKFNAKLCSVGKVLALPYKNLRRLLGRNSPFQAHHVFQDARAIGAIANYKSLKAIAIPLLGGTSLKGGAHRATWLFQIGPGKLPSPASVHQMRAQAYKALLLAGCRKRDATEIVQFAETVTDLMRLGVY